MPIRFNSPQYWKNSNSERLPHTGPLKTMENYGCEAAIVTEVFKNAEDFRLSCPVFKKDQKRAVK